MKYYKNGRHFDTFQEAFNFACLSPSTCKGCSLHRIDEDGKDLCVDKAKDHGCIPESVEKQICQLMGIVRIRQMKL